MADPRPMAGTATEPSDVATTKRGGKTTARPGLAIAAPVLTLLMALLVAATARPALAGEKGGFRVAESYVRTSVHVIALEPASVPVGTPDADAIRGRLEADAAVELGRGGFRVLPSSVFAGLWQRHARELGGVFDPQTGLPLPDKYAACLARTLKELASLHHADAVLETGVSESQGLKGENWVGYYRVFGEQVVWDGQPLKLKWEDHPQHLVSRVYAARLTGIDGVVLYDAVAGVEWARVYTMREYRDKPGLPLADAGRCALAVREALASLTGTPSDPSRSR